MDPYTFGLTRGSVGLGVMALSGFARVHAGRARERPPRLVSRALGMAPLITAAGVGRAAGKPATNGITDVTRTIPAAHAIRRAGALDGSVSALPGPPR